MSGEIKTVVIEDEPAATHSLVKLISEVCPEVSIVAALQSIEESVEWLTEEGMPDLLFMDIHLADGSSFAIFDKVDVTCPIIFTTAYDEYALKAFEVNGISYLLKPIDKMDLEKAIAKFKSLTHTSQENKSIINRLLAELGDSKKKFKTCFLVPERDKLIPLGANSIAYVYIDVKMVKAVSFDGRGYYLSQTLDELMNQMDPAVFFRANRQFIVSRGAIKDISIWSGNKLSLNLTVSVPEKIIVSKARVSEFKSWFSE